MTFSLAVLIPLDKLPRYDGICRAFSNAYTYLIESFRSRLQYKVRYWW